MEGEGTNLCNQRFGFEIKLRLGKVLGTPTALAVLPFKNKFPNYLKPTTFPVRGIWANDTDVVFMDDST